MREILFRGKTTDGEWSEGYYNGKHIVTWYDRELWLPQGEKIMPMQHMIDVIPETVGQYTGLHDMNGKRIFEGDIFRDGFDVISVVEWTEDGRFLGFAINKKPTWDTKKRLITYIAKEAKIEVIGNIHDNPEILEGYGNETKKA